MSLLAARIDVDRQTVQVAEGGIAPTQSVNMTAEVFLVCQSDFVRSHGERKVSIVALLIATSHSPRSPSGAILVADAVRVPHDGREANI